MPTATPLASRLARAVERSDALARWSGPVNAAVRALPVPQRVRTLLSGTALGHPVHPFLVATPIGLWTGATLLDVMGGPGGARAAQTLVGAGVATVVPTAITGLSDWADTTGAEQQVGFAHLACNLAATSCYSLSWWARRRRHRGAGIAWSLAGALLASGGGWLGGHLAYALGVGVDTNAFEGGPADWSPVEGHRPDTGEMSEGAVAGVALLLADDGGRVRALANRCSHRGAPLSDGTLADGCVTCPWHRSRFDIVTGEVQEGPAVVPQPVYEIRSTADGLEARRDEARTLRVNSARPDGAGREG